MKKEELKIIITVSVVIATIVAFLQIIILSIPFEIRNFLRSLSLGLSTTTVFWVFYISTGWRWPLLKHIFYRPNLNGTWSGKLISSYKMENGDIIDPIIFHIVIRQSFLKIHLTTFTEDFVARSYAETLSLQKEKGLKNIVYLYRRDSSQNHNGFLQEGGAELRLIEGDKKILDGKYWTNQNTNGTIYITKITNKHMDSYDQAINLQK